MTLLTLLYILLGLVALIGAYFILGRKPEEFLRCPECHSMSNTLTVGGICQNCEEERVLEEAREQRDGDKTRDPSFDEHAKRIAERTLDDPNYTPHN